MRTPMVAGGHPLVHQGVRSKQVLSGPAFSFSWLVGHGDYLAKCSVVVESYAVVFKGAEHYTAVLDRQAVNGLEELPLDVE